MEKKFFIHPSILIVEKIIISTCFTIIGIMWIIPFLLPLEFRQLRPGLFKFALFITITISLGIYFFRLIFNDLKHTEYILTTEHIIKKSPMKTVTIPLNQISAFQFVRLPFGIGYGQITTHKHKFRFPFIIENLYELILTIKGYFVGQDNNPLVNKHELSALINRAILSDFHERQARLILNPLFSITIYSVFFSFFVALWFWNMPLQYVMSWTFCGLIFPILGYLTVHYYLSRKVLRHLNSFPLMIPAIDSAGYYRTGAAITTLFYSITGIVYKVIAS